MTDILIFNDSEYGSSVVFNELKDKIQESKIDLLEINKKELYLKTKECNLIFCSCTMACYGGLFMNNVKYYLNLIIGVHGQEKFEYGMKYRIPKEAKELSSIDELLEIIKR